MFAKRSSKFAVLATASVAVAALTLGALPAQAFNPRSEAGVTATTIKLGITTPLTGSAAPGYSKVPAAMQATLIM